MGSIDNLLSTTIFYPQSLTFNLALSMLSARVKAMEGNLCCFQRIIYRKTILDVINQIIYSEFLSYECMEVSKNGWVMFKLEI